MSGTEEQVISHGTGDDGAIDNGSIAGQSTGRSAEHAEGAAAGSDATGSDAAGPDSARRGDTGSGGDPAGRLIEESKAQDYQDRWNKLKGEFVDDPQHVVRGVDRLVSEVLDELEQVFRTQRGNLESAAGDGASTEDLRVAFGKYREFFDRLLSI